MSSLTTVVLFVLFLGMAGIVWGIVALVRRQQYIRSLRDRGWEFVNSPTIDAVARVGNPPFGIGFRRRPDDQITGRTRSGRPFQVIDYSSEHWAGWVGMVTLSRRLPELWVSGGQTEPRYGVKAQVMPVPAQLGPGWQVGALDAGFAAEVVTPQLCAALNAMAGGQPGLNLSIDGEQLVVLDPPHKEPEVLGPWLEQLAALAVAIDATPLDRWIQPEQPPRISFYHHPEWYWIGEDNTLLQTTPVTRGGHGHTTSDVIRGRDGDGPPFVAFSHQWKTTRTESYTDSQGNSQTPLRLAQPRPPRNPVPTPRRRSPQTQLTLVPAAVAVWTMTAVASSEGLLRGQWWPVGSVASAVRICEMRVWGPLGVVRWWRSCGQVVRAKVWARAAPSDSTAKRVIPVKVPVMACSAAWGSAAAIQ